MGVCLGRRGLRTHFRKPQSSAEQPPRCRRQEVFISQQQKAVDAVDLKPQKHMLLPGVSWSLAHKHEFFVDMTCEGCANAVSRVLNKLGGVQFEIDLPNKKVFIDSEHSVDTLLETLSKTGKTVSSVGPK